MAQNNRSVTADTPLGDDQLVFYSMAGTESIGRLFEFEVELVRDLKLGSVKADQLLGKGMTVKLDLPNGGARFFNGEIVQFKHIGLRSRFSCYRATLRPWLWYLTLNADCRIFQDKSVIEVIKAILDNYAFADVLYKLDGEYKTLDYCVQYRESDFDFISRLMEHDGIFYYFEHQDGKHKLVITDSNKAFETQSGYQSIPYFSEGNVANRERDHIHEWFQENQVTAGKFELNDFDFESPSSDLTIKKHNPGSYSQSGQEVYDFPGKFSSTTVDSKLVDKRLEEKQNAYSVKRGQGNALRLIPGMKFTLSDFYFDEENIEHVVVSASYIIQGDDCVSGMGGGGDIFQCSFDAIDAKQAFRSIRSTPKPSVSGSQTAIVVGPSGEEIWTDKYGRVKVKFHWDREGHDDENSSCWVRVSQPMAGKKWGWVSLPRIGQEVVVSFLEGDPDRPLITGRVYNDDQMPPYDLPSNKTQSGIKTRSSKEGTADNFNELRFEDKKGEEEVYIHAEKDLNCVIENNETRKIGLDKKDKGDQTIEIQNDRTVTLHDGNDKLKIETGNRNIEIDQGNYDLKVSTGNHSVKIDSGKSTIEAMQSIELKVGGNSIEITQAGITIKGTMIKVEGSAMSEIKSPMTTVKGDGMLILQGGLTKIN